MMDQPKKVLGHVGTGVIRCTLEVQGILFCQGPGFRGSKQAILLTTAHVKQVAQVSGDKTLSGRPHSLPLPKTN